MSRAWEVLPRAEAIRDTVVPPIDLADGAIRLTELQQGAIRALLRSETIAEAATAAGVPERTLRRWLARPGFVSEYFRHGKAELDSSRRRLEAATEASLAALRRAQAILKSVQALIRPRPAAAAAAAVERVDAVAPESSG